MKIVLSAAAIGLLLQGPGQLGRIDDYAGQASEFSIAAGLPALTATSSVPEARVWRSAALIESTTGWVITPDKISVYSGPNQDRLWLVATITTPQAQDILQALSQLGSYNGQRVSCSRIKDGWGLHIEGSSSTDHFAFAAGNPNQCTDGAAHEVWQAFSQLLNVTHGAP